MNHVRSIVLPRRRIHIGIALSLSALALPTVALASPPPVFNCDDHGTGSLRAAISDPGTRAGDVIDMSALTCDRIDLQTAISVPQSSLAIVGAGRDAFVISANYRDRVFVHGGTSELSLQNLTLSEGYADGNGGCIKSNGNVALANAVVSRCIAWANQSNGTEQGGGLHVVGNLRLYRTIIIGNVAGSAISRHTEGGGAFVGGDLISDYSSLIHNAAEGDTKLAEGGAAKVIGDVSITGSTLSGNIASRGGALSLGGTAGASANIESSTFSGNIAQSGAGAVLAWNIPLTISHSTIVNNNTLESLALSETYGAVAEVGNTLTLHSSILAGNELVDTALPADVSVLVSGTVAGSPDNFISAANVSIPGGVHSDCPRLGPLGNNGGPTATHAVLADSHVIDNGSADPSLTLDQRNAERHVRSPDIGSVERQDGEIDDRLFASAFEPVCDI
jgi:hypothetical protein